MATPGARIREGMKQLNGIRARIDDHAAQLMYGLPVGRVTPVPREPAPDPEETRRQLQLDMALAVGAIEDVLVAMLEIAGPTDVSTSS